MRFLIEPLLPPASCAAMAEALDQPDALWGPGEASAGWHARAVKHNQQLDTASALHQRLAESLRQALVQHPLVQAAAFPRRVHSILFSRCGPGQGYGRHVDNAWMGAGRSDLSFTVALTAADAYSGGALVLESPSGEEAFRLPVGHALVYPSTLLHRVESRIRHGDQRELLFELDTARRALFERHGKDEIFDLVSRSYSNLLRRWDA
jgi:PKHD-type hydroxylase